MAASDLWRYNDVRIQLNSNTILLFAFENKHAKVAKTTGDDSLTTTQCALGQSCISGQNPHTGGEGGKEREREILWYDRAGLSSPGLATSQMTAQEKRLCCRLTFRGTSRQH